MFHCFVSESRATIIIIHLCIYSQGSYGIVKLAYNEEDETHYVSKKHFNEAENKL